MERPLPDDVARPARAYLAALVPADEVSDAWHELLADVAYWGDRHLLAVLRLAHQVVLQHERVTPEAAALALVEVGVDAPADVAAVLDADPTDARAWTEAARATRDGDEPAVKLDAASPPEPAPQPVPSATPAAPEPRPAARSETPRAEVTRPDTPRPAPSDPEPAPGAVRIGFEDDEPLPAFHDDAGRRLTTRTIVLVAVVLWVLVVLLWTLLR